MIAISIRILAGKHKNYRLTAPPRDTLRPTAEWVRASAFNILIHRFFKETIGLPPEEQLAGKQVLDLFSGIGTYAFEALSRGAAHAVCVDAMPPTFILQHAKALGLTEKIQCVQCLLPASFLCPKVDLVFADPPYDFPIDVSTAILDSIHPHMAKEGVLLFETVRPSINIPTYMPLFSKKVRKTWLHFFTPL